MLFSFKNYVEGDVEQQVEGELDMNKLRTRMSPFGLYTFLSDISEEQRKNIYELGFQFLLSLRIEKIPSRLARWLVESFDTCRRAIKLCGGDELRIGEEDVYLTMGFPRGSKPVSEARKNDKGVYLQILDEWKGQWGGVLPKTHQLLSQMKSQKQGGDLFKRNFIVYLVSTLIKGHQSLRVNHIVIKSLVNLEEVKGLNWCEFTLDSLITCTDKWKRQPKGLYRGPILFLMVITTSYYFYLALFFYLFDALSAFCCLCFFL